MKALGVVRKLDSLGRIVLPKATRTEFRIDTGDGMEIFVEGESIILKKHVPGCIFCGEVENIREYKGKKVCLNCAVNVSLSIAEHKYWR